MKLIQRYVARLRLKVLTINKDRYIIRSLVDEAISLSQLEGAGQLPEKSHVIC